MKKLKIDLENCYGIKALKDELDFSRQKACAIYAPNGSMKSSLAKTFKDIADGVASGDRVFPDRVSKRTITDQDDVDIPKDNVFVAVPYDEDFSHSEKTSTLLVNSELRMDYEQLFIEIDNSKTRFLDALRKDYGLKRKDLEKEISLAITQREDYFYIALGRIESELAAQKDAPFADIKYNIIFNDRVLKFLETSDFKTTVEDFVKRYNELLDASTYFKKGIFNYYNAATIAKILADNGFFNAKHTVRLNADESLEISTRKQLEDLIEDEKKAISDDQELRAKLAVIEDQINKNKDLKDFQNYLVGREDLLPQLANLGSFKQEVWMSYFHEHYELYLDLITKYRDTEKKRKAIEKEAGEQRTQWEDVIEIFNERFSVPFKLEAKNRISVLLAQEPMISLAFTFQDGRDTASIEKGELMRILSTGEKKAFYILNIIFEVETRKKENQETIFILDDIADSFDYKNKYAIIQYLQDIAEVPNFYQIILTHNFDFFRTVQSRFIPYSHCLMAFKNESGVKLRRAEGIRNIFVEDWKIHFFDDPKKKIASISFTRNIIEYTKDNTDLDFVKLTSLLHWKSDTAKITQGELDDIFTVVFNVNGNSSDRNLTVIDIIHREAIECLTAPEGINFENKIVLSIAIRIASEKFMVDKINDPAFVAGIAENQTPKLLGKYKECPDCDQEAIDTIQQVILMTPENIHLNSFMYEPILDMSEDHLRKLYKRVRIMAGMQ